MQSNGSKASQFLYRGRRACQRNPDTSAEIQSLLGQNACRSLGHRRGVTTLRASLRYLSPIIYKLNSLVRDIIIICMICGKERAWVIGVYGSVAALNHHFQFEAIQCLWCRGSSIILLPSRHAACGRFALQWLFFGSSVLSACQQHQPRMGLGIPMHRYLVGNPHQHLQDTLNQLQ